MRKGYCTLAAPHTIRLSLPAAICHRICSVNQLFQDVWIVLYVSVFLCFFQRRNRFISTTQTLIQTRERVCLCVAIESFPETPQLIHVVVPHDSARVYVWHKNVWLLFRWVAVNTGFSVPSNPISGWRTRPVRTKKLRKKLSSNSILPVWWMRYDMTQPEQTRQWF